MFCNKCGAELADSAVFCNKCGAQLGGAAAAAKPVKDKKPVIMIAGVVIIVAIVVIAVVFLKKGKPVLYGTWESDLLTIEIEEDGEMSISGEYNILGNNKLKYTEQDGALRLEAEEVSGSSRLTYELEKDVLTLSVAGESLQLYSPEYKEATPATDEETVSSFVDAAFRPFQILGLYDYTWTDSSGVVSFLFKKDGTVQIVGADTVGVNLLEYEIIDTDTFNLKFDTEKIPLDELGSTLGILNINMDYKIVKDTLTLTAMNEDIVLYKK